jgi:ECF sigma factor
MQLEADTVTQWLGSLKAGEAPAAQPHWNRYFARLVELAWRKPRAMRTSTTAADGEDNALSALDSLFEGIRAGRFPQLADRTDLWKTLGYIAACKAVDWHRHET